MEYEGLNFAHIRLEGEELNDLHFDGCTFVHCELIDTKLVGCSFTDCKFEHCKALNGIYTHVNASDNAFTDCALIGIQWPDFMTARSVRLPFASLVRCKLSYNVFHGMRMKRIDFGESDLTGCIFEDCDLSESKFCHCTLSEATFSNNNLMHADFRGAKAYEFSTAENRIRQAKFSFPEVMGLLKALEIVVE